MTLTRVAEDVWNEIVDKAEQHHRDGTPILTLVRQVANYITEVEDDKLWRQSSDPFSEEGGPSPVAKREVEKIWLELCQRGQAVEGKIFALRFAWALVARFIEGIEFRPDPFRLIVADEKLANATYGNKRIKPQVKSAGNIPYLVLMQYSSQFTKYDDQIGDQYPFPSQYFDRITQGARFIYCRPQEESESTVYFGTGTIGAVRDDVTMEGHRYCQIEDYFAFPQEVPYRDATGKYLETGSMQIPVMQNAVRLIDEIGFDRIIQRSGLRDDPTALFPKLQAARTGVQEVRAVNEAYATATPKLKQYLTTRVERGSAIGGKVKELNRYVCQVCGAQPFATRTGRPYAEAHHVVPLHKLESGSLASHNVVCLCPNCHRKMHYGNADLVSASRDTIVFEIEGERITVRRNKL
jgi:5-methylcytosine-specific restriction endonuclease McrA